MNTRFYKLIMPISIGIAGILLYSSCSIRMPKGAQPVANFNLEKYLGKWYELARLDHRFEKNMDRNTAEYSLKENGAVKVYNRGYDNKKSKWKSATGEARPVGDSSTGRLKVAFMKPFWAAYNVIDVDPNYEYALVAGKNLKYLWILSRHTTIPDHYKNRFLKKAQQLGYDTDALIWVSQ